MFQNNLLWSVLFQRLLSCKFQLFFLGNIHSRGTKNYDSCSCSIKAVFRPLQKCVCLCLHSHESKRLWIFLHNFPWNWQLQQWWMNVYFCKVFHTEHILWCAKFFFDTDIKKLTRSAAEIGKLKSKQWTVPDWCTCKFKKFRFVAGCD